MKVLVVGATGTLGRQIVRRAIDEGHQVRCLVRPTSRATFLKEWGADLISADLCYPESLPLALQDMEAVIDAATTRATDNLSFKQVDWEGKVSLIQATQAAGIDRFIFFSILENRNFPKVPLMEIKRCTELYLAESGLNYTILQPSGFMQNLIGQYAIPILDNQPVWVTGTSAAIAYMDTQDVAKFAVRALTRPDTQGKTFPVVGTRAWSAEEIIRLCERLSGREAKTLRMPLKVLQSMRQFLGWFEWGWNVADRLAFTEVLASGQILQSSMAEVYQAFDLDPEDTTTLEQYLQEYFGRILKKLKEIDYEQAKAKKQPKPKTTFRF
jgi:uncharacterized protein YbjT (DUF2867 family)